MLITIVELPEYIKRVEKILSKDERDELLYYLSFNTKSGTLMQGTGGVRKLRWASKGKGKSGGSRVIYFIYNETIPLFLLTIFSKNEKINLSKTERNKLAELVKELVKSYKR
jgi:mRNA-degrading endonuclease RelE of RelBE toxin-antitoxin system